MNNDNYFNKLEIFLLKIPSVKKPIGTGMFENKNWWVKFSIDIENKLAWNVVQELGHVLNHFSIEEKLPVVFIPVSPPPYLNGGPKDFLTWVIESREPDFTPAKCTEWLEGRLPRPVDDISKWDEMGNDIGNNK